MKITLKDINNITNIEELSKYDNIIRSKAKIMCDNKLFYDDIVNDMYILVNEKLLDGKIINGGYVFLTMRNLITNYHKRNNKWDKNLDVEDFYIADDPDDFRELLENLINDELLYNELNERISKLTWYEQKLMQHSYEMSLLELHRKSGISYRSLIYTKNKINKKIGLKNRKYIKKNKENGEEN